MMKKITMIAAFVAITCSVMAQKVANDTIIPPLWNNDWKLMITAGTTKTVGLKSGYGGTGKYAFGINNYNDRGNCQQFTTTKNINVIGTLLWLGDVSGTGNIDVKVWSYGGTAAYLYNPSTSGVVGGAPGPNTVLTSKTVSLSTLQKYDSGINANEGPDRKKMNPIMFTTPGAVSLGSSTNMFYYVGIEHTLTGASGNKLGFMSSADGLVNKGTNKCFIKSDVIAADPWKWVACGATWSGTGNDYSLCIFPIVQAVGGSGINEEVEVDGVKLSNYPNPANGNTTVAYELANDASSVIVKVLDINGNEISSYNEGSKVAGAYTIDVNVSNMAAGNYFLTIEAGASRMAKMMNVVK